MPNVEQYFQDFVTIENSDSGYETMAKVLVIENAATAGVEIVVGQITCPAQQELAWGHGSIQFPSNQGYMQFYFLDATTAFDVGEVRLKLQDNLGLKNIVMKSILDIALHATGVTVATALTIDRNSAYPLPRLVNPAASWVGRDSRMVISYNSKKHSGTADAAFWSIPITRKIVSQ